MNRAHHLGRIATAMSAIFVTSGILSCITVNVNFPESAVQRAADDFVRDLYHGNQTGNQSGNQAVAAEKTAEKTGEATTPKEQIRGTASKKKSAPAKPLEQKSPQSFFEWTWLIPNAFAQELTFSPKARQIQDKMRSRLGELQSFKQKGVLCEAPDGMLEVQDMSKAGTQASAVAKLVKTENGDRNDLYEELAAANHISDPKQKRIRTIFATAFGREGPPACK